jgi:hypothetical protein
MTSTYSISFPITGYGTFNGIFTINNSDNRVQSFYDNTNPRVNILKTEFCLIISTYKPATNVLECIINNPNKNNNKTYMILYNNANNLDIPRAYAYSNGDCNIDLLAIPTTYTIIPYIPNRFSLKNICCSIYSDNALVYYKPHSLATAGSGTVRNSRKKGRKT